MASLTFLSLCSDQVKYLVDNLAFRYREDSNWAEKLYEEVLSNEENAISTDNKKIKRAKVREYDYEEILETYATFEKLSLAVEIIPTVKLMKEFVPEYKSNHSVYEKLDR